MVGRSPAAARQLASRARRRVRGAEVHGSDADLARQREMVDALFFLRRLWAIFMDDLNNPQNELTPQLRAGLISIGIWVNKEIERVRTGATKDLTAMIEINEIIRDGLT